MFGLIAGIFLIPAAMIIFLRVGRTIRDMLVYSTDLSVSKSAKLHDGIFDKQGNVVSGPPPRPLDRYETRVENDQLLILVD